MRDDLDTRDDLDAVAQLLDVDDSGINEGEHEIGDRDRDRDRVQFVHDK